MRRSLTLFLFIATTNVYSFVITDVSKKQSSLHQMIGNNIEDDENNNNNVVLSNIVSRRNLLSSVVATTVLSTLLIVPTEVQARLESINNPKLLPNESGLNVIQIEKFLTSGQEKRLNTLLINLEKDTGYRVRVLCQAYPNTPGLAIREYWDLGYDGQKDDKYIVLIVDQFGGKGNVLNFNVGDGMKLILPNIFWTRLQSKYGTTFYVRDNGIDLSITNAIDSIVTCLRSEEQYCVNVPDAIPSLKSLGFS